MADPEVGSSLAPMRLTVLPLLALVLLPAVARAQGQAPRQVILSATLDFQPGTATGVCADPAYLRERLSTDLGHDPFAPATKGVPAGNVRVVIAHSPRGYTATVDYTNAAGVPRKPRVWEDPVCENVLKGAALTLLAVFTRFEDSPQPSPPPPEPTAPASEPAPVPPSPPAVPAPAPARPPKPTFRIEAGVDAVFMPVISPSASAGVGPWVALHSLELPLSLELGLRATWSVVPAHEPVTPIRSTYFSGVVAPCYHWRALFGCGVLEVGTMNFYLDGHAGSLHVLDPVVVAAGFRGGARYVFADRWIFRGLAEVEGVPKGPHGRNETDMTWGTRGYAFTLGMGIGLNLW
jgi:hypothetical protein